MQAINAVRSVFGIGTAQWNFVLELEDGSEKRFAVAGPDHVETLIEAFDDAAQAVYDPEKDEIVFSYDFAISPLEDEEDEEDEDEAEESDDEDEADHAKSKD